MNRVLVTGATGFIGANVARVLLERGYRVRVLVRPSSDLGNIENLDVEIVTGDLRDALSVHAAVAGCDEVYHVAAEYNFWSPDPSQTYKSNVEGTRHVMEAALQCGVRRVVYTSTVGTMGLADQPLACDENTPMTNGQLTSHYKRSKLEAEHVALSYVTRGLPVVVVNPSAPIGPWDRKPTPTGKIIVDFVLGKMPAYLNTGLNLIHVHDVAVGHWLAAQKGRIGERYILGHQNLTLQEILGMLSQITNLPAPRVRIPYAVAWMAGLVSTTVSDWVTRRPPAVALEAVKMARRHMFFDASKAVRELGLPQTSVEKALEDAVEWFAASEYFKLNTRSGLGTNTDARHDIARAS